MFYIYELYKRVIIKLKETNIIQQQYVYAILYLKLHGWPLQWHPVYLFFLVIISAWSKQTAFPHPFQNGSQQNTLCF